MKKTIITLMLAIVAMAAFAQSDSTKAEAPKTYTIKLEVKAGDEELLYFALGQAPLMDTDVAARRVKLMAAQLNAWLQAVQAQIEKKKPAKEGGKK
jgi:hypothetical protein